jgi:hypothetical protein
MKFLTVLNHGTCNSTNTDTSDGNELVITKIMTLLQEFDQSLLNQGAGTKELRDTGVVSGDMQGIFNGQGVEENVLRSLAWIRQKKQESAEEITVNLVGHSRGSITCYKIAHKMGKSIDLNRVRVNIFAIDPVPGNTGNFITRNGANYENIVLGTNVKEGNSFLMLAESEHRVVFRAYVDALYADVLGNHEFDTIPGTHGGINMLLGYEREAASLVLSRALVFLRTHGSTLKPKADAFMLSDDKRLELYRKLMERVYKYEAHASVNPFRKNTNSWESVKNLAFSGFQVDKHRIVNVNHAKAVFAMRKDPDRPADQPPQKRKNFHGLKLRDAVDRTAELSDSDFVYATRAQRFFCNREHEALFRARYELLAVPIAELERATKGAPADREKVVRDLDGAVSEFNAMTGPERAYLKAYLRKTGIHNTLLLLGA